MAGEAVSDGLIKGRGGMRCKGLTDVNETGSYASFIRHGLVLK